MKTTMNPDEAADLAAFAKTITTPLSAAIFLLLRRSKELSVLEIVAATDESQPAVSHHLAKMRHTDLVRVRRDGKFSYYRLSQDTVKDFSRYLTSKKKVANV